MRLCFLVNVRKARGRKAVGGSLMGSTEGLDCSTVFDVRIGYAGVPKAGDDEGMTSECVGCLGRWKMGAFCTKGACDSIFADF